MKKAKKSKINQSKNTEKQKPNLIDKKKYKEPLVLAGHKIELGQDLSLEIEVGRLYDSTPLSIPVRVIRGKKMGARLFLSAGIHGDEINGVEILRRVLNFHALRKIAGTLIVVPIVNVFGFNRRSRYFLDRRDLNRSFPGSTNGSLAAQVAAIFMKEIVNSCQYGIDFHTGSLHRSNLPQIRAWLMDQATKNLALAFSTPVILNSTIRDGSLRQAALERGLPMLLFEGGEALRFNENAIRSGVYGTLAVMHSLGMINFNICCEMKKSFIAKSSHWIRAPRSGILGNRKKLGERIKKNETLGIIYDLLGKEKTTVKALYTGIIIGMIKLPLINRGDALFHIATFNEPDLIEEKVSEYSDLLDDDVWG
ncbi:succinylglutamate desuccinylase/aspartoacylase family protein [Candidatus Riflebacteria bacterium]